MANKPAPKKQEGVTDPKPSAKPKTKVAPKKIPVLTPGAFVKVKGQKEKCEIFSVDTEKEIVVVYVKTKQGTLTRSNPIKLTDISF